MMKTLLSSVLLGTCLLVGAHQSVQADESLEAVRASLQKFAPELPLHQLQASPVSGLYHAVVGGNSGYVTADGRYFIPGDLIDMKSRVNVTEQGRQVQRVELLRNIQLADTIVFAPSKPRHTITVFTDVDCGYCRKLHSEIAQYNELGIAVRYLAFPRSGPDTESWSKMEAVWCSGDRQGAITRAKLGEAMPKPADCTAPQIAHDYALGEQVGVQGTPTIVLEDGSVIGGYMPPTQLAAQLSQLKQAPVAEVR